MNNGDIFVCPNVPRRPELIQGNILTDSFSEVWCKGFEEFRNRTLPEKCNSCDHKDVCNGDSFHTMDFETGTPLFCYRDQLKTVRPEKYKKFLFDNYPDTKFCEISGDDDNAPEVIIEPRAYRFICSYFNIGEKHPLSMFEQQMALIGFTAGNMSVVRYAVPCDGTLRAPDNALFTNNIFRTTERELAIINKNYYNSTDRGLCGSEPSQEKPMKFLGFIHSHPTQSELQYSTGDESIHRRMIKKYGDYIGILVNPADSTIGAYYGSEIKQAKLILPEVKD